MLVYNKVFFQLKILKIKQVGIVMVAITNIAAVTHKQKDSKKK